MSFGLMIFLIENFNKKRKKNDQNGIKNDEIHEWMIKISPGDCSTICNYHKILIGLRARCDRSLKA